MPVDDGFASPKNVPASNQDPIPPMIPTLVTGRSDSRTELVSERFLRRLSKDRDSCDVTRAECANLHPPTRWVTFLRASLLVATLVASGCKADGKESSALAGRQIGDLAKASAEDVKQLRAGMPLGAAEVDKLLPATGLVDLDHMVARETLNKARSRVQDLRLAKSTVFALVAPSGSVVRSDGEQDRLAGKDMFAGFPELKGALGGAYKETRGSMAEAAEVRGRPDAQRVVAAPIGQGAGVRGLYVSGWSWSAYAYRLENAARSSSRSAAPQGAKVPLLYVYVVVGPDVYGAPISPDVNAKAVRELDLPNKAQGGATFTTELELTGRVFGLAAVRAPELGDGVVIALLRSET
jgi:hypothetical protein